MDWIAEYTKAWSRHGIHFGASCGLRTLRRNAEKFRSILAPLNLLDLNPDLPADVTLTLSVDDECLIYRFPHRYRTKKLRGCRGQLNDRFFNPESLLRVLEGVSERSIILLSIPQIYPTEGLSFHTFLGKLDRFLSALPKLRRYALQLHNPNYLLPDYFECLRKHNVAHVMHEDAVFTTEFGVVISEDKLNVVDAVRKATGEGRRLYVYFEEELALAELMELLNEDLKRLSPLRKSRAA